MVYAIIGFACVIVAWLAYAAWLATKQHITYTQAILLVPLAILWRVDARALRSAHEHDSIIYVISHQSKLDAALMLSLLPENTLHILDNYSARAGWLEPWRTLARTISFNPEHLFVSRRLVRVLKGGGRLAVYMPLDVEPGNRAFRLYRAVARIALRANAKVMPIHISGAGRLPFALDGNVRSWDQLFTKLILRSLAPATIDELVAKSDLEGNTSSTALFGRVVQARGDDAPYPAAA